MGLALTVEGGKDIDIIKIFHDFVWLCPQAKRKHHLLHFRVRNCYPRLREAQTIGQRVVKCTQYFPLLWTAVDILNFVCETIKLCLPYARRSSGIIHLKAGYTYVSFTFLNTDIVPGKMCAPFLADNYSFNIVLIEEHYMSQLRCEFSDLQC